MAGKKKTTYFWTTYSDFMSSLFFIMLVLFVLTAVLLIKRITATEAELEKIKQINASIEKIDSTYFEYDANYKRHTLKNIQVSFKSRSSDINDLSDIDKKNLLKAGRAIVKFMNDAKRDIPDAEYLLIIEGQTSKDNYSKNYELSYGRALSLVRYWERNKISFSDLPCEVIISGSGFKSPFRKYPDIASNKHNQRFVIHIVPKPGMIE
jgi:outer membrane protein OmpA-like peptidoglycan-associated protein